MPMKNNQKILLFFSTVLLAFNADQTLSKEIESPKIVEGIKIDACNNDNKLSIADGFLMSDYMQLDGGTATSCTFFSTKQPGIKSGIGFINDENTMKCSNSVSCAKRVTRKGFGYRTNKKITEKVIAGHKFYCATSKSKFNGTDQVNQYCNMYFDGKRIWLDLVSPVENYSDSMLSNIFIEIHLTR
jgi:hypothetical protein